MVIPGCLRNIFRVKSAAAPKPPQPTMDKCFGIALKGWTSMASHPASALAQPSERAPRQAAAIVLRRAGEASDLDRADEDRHIIEDAHKRSIVTEAAKVKSPAIETTISLPIDPFRSPAARPANAVACTPTVLRRRPRDQRNPRKGPDAPKPSCPRRCSGTPRLRIPTDLRTPYRVRPKLKASWMHAFMPCPPAGE
jgi:hypothetical protein